MQGAKFLTDLRIGPGVGPRGIIYCGWSESGEKHFEVRRIDAFQACLDAGLGCIDVVDADIHYICDNAGVKAEIAKYDKLNGLLVEVRAFFS